MNQYLSIDPEYERRRQAAYRRLGSNDPRCLVCGETDWRCLELHHIAGQAHDDLGGIHCRNCHRKQSEAWMNAAGPTDPPVMERVGHLLLGLATLLDELVSRLRLYGKELITGAAVSPWPYGWVDAPENAR